MDLSVLAEAGGEGHMAECVRGLTGLDLPDLEAKPFGGSKGVFDVGAIEPQERLATRRALEIIGITADIGGVARAHQRFGGRRRRARDEGAAAGLKAPPGAAGAVNHAAKIAPAPGRGQSRSGCLGGDGGFQNDGLGRPAEQIALAFGAAPARQRVELGLLLDALGGAADAEAARQR